VLFTGEALFLRRRHNAAIHHQRRRAVVVKSGDTQDSRHGKALRMLFFVEGVKHGFGTQTLPAFAKVAGAVGKVKTVNLFCVFGFRLN
jgi:hypothetical protein